MSASERGRVRVERGQKRVRAFLDGQLVVDTFAPLLVWEVPYYPTYYLPLDDVQAELVPTGDVDRSPSRGAGHRHDVKLPDGATAANAAVTFPESPLEDLHGHVRLDWDAMSSWFEEDEQVYVHVRSPYTRIDVLPTSRHVEVRLGDVVLADTTRASALFETGLPPRWYIPKVDVRMDLLVPSDTVTRCPYKGQASHYSARIGDEETADVAWTYPAPLAESQRIASLVAFYDRRVTVTIDGVPVA